MPERGEANLRREIVRICRRLYERELIAASEGNVSARMRGGSILITPAGASKSDLEESDLVVVSPRGQTVAAAQRPSSELGMHLRIYERRRDVHAVVHAHPPLATAFAVAGEDLMEPVLPELLVQTRGVPLVPYAAPGSGALADAFEPFLPLHDAFLMANHGATTLGATLSVAYQRMETLEHVARILLAARLLGRVTPLTEEQRRELLASSAEDRTSASISGTSGSTPPPE